MNERLYIAALLVLVPATAVSGWAWWRVRQRRLGVETAVSPRTLWQQVKTWWRTELRENEGQMMQVIVAGAALFTSISLGAVYVRQPWVDGWQLWTWLISVGVLVTAVTPWRHIPRVHIPHRYWLYGLLLLTLLLRLPLLSVVPGGLHVDEMGVAGYAVQHVFPPAAQTINPFHTGASSQPALYHYLIRLSFALFGYTIPALRLTSALAGTAAVLATYLLVRTFANARTGLLAAALMSTYHYHVHWSRIGLNNIWDTLWVPLVLAAFAWGYRRNWSGGAVLAGVALGLAQYFYGGNKIVLFMLPLLLWMLYRERRDGRRLLIHAGKLAVTAVAVGAPITLFALIQPDIFFARSRVVYAWQREAIIAAVGDYNVPQYVWQQIWRNVGAFTSVPEVTGFYGPGVPFLFGIAAPLFLIGVLWAIWRRNWLPLAWLALTIFFGGIMLTGAPSSSHFVVVIPAICWLTAVPLNWLWENGRWRLALLLVVAIMLTDLFFYFGMYVPSGPRDLFNDLPPWPFGN